MIYGLYLSATGVLTNSHRQDVIANNLANSETVGFKRHMSLFQERPTECASAGLDPSRQSDPLLEDLGGGLLASPTAIDLTPGDIEETGNPLDMAIEGRGFFVVREGGELRLTRDGRLFVDQAGQVVLSDGQEVLDTQGRPIFVDRAQKVQIDKDGFLTQDGRPVARLGFFDVADPQLVRKLGGNMLAYAGLSLKGLLPAAGRLHNGYLERSNVDPATELTQLMEAQRQLEANANMIRYQDQTLARLVNDVGRIG